MSEEKKNAAASMKQRIKEEYMRCLIDPIYFMKKYVKIQHPIKGTINFDLYEFQERTLEDFVDKNKNIILKSRQMGISTLVAAYSLWLMVFHEDKNIRCISITQDTSKEIVTRVRFANDNLPSWLKVKCKEDNRLSLVLANGSTIKAESSAGTAGRSAALSLLIIDEAAFIDNIEEIWLSAQFTLSTGGKSIILSTPSGVGNFFHKTWMEAEEGKNGFNTIRLPWNLHPERDQSWRDNQTKLNGVKGAAQECDCVFETTGNTVVDLILLNEHKKQFVRDPIEIRGRDKNLWLWDLPNPGDSYIVSADVARGDAADFSACQIINTTTLEQVGEYQGHMDTKSFGNFLVNVATEFNDALLIIENNNMGWAVLQEVMDRNYRNLFFSTSDLKYVDVERQMTSKYNREDKKMVPGFSTTSATRPLIVSKLELYFRENSLKIHSIRLYNELTTFVWNGAKAEAMTKCNDDLVMSYSIGLWVRDTALKLQSRSMDLNKSMLMGINRSAPSDTKIYTSAESKGSNTWLMQVGSKKESLTWLL